MAVERKIDDVLMDKIENLSMLQLSDTEREKAMAEMEQILSYVEIMNQLDTENIEASVQIGEQRNRLREDEISNGDGAQDLLANAPLVCNQQIVVPKTIG